MRVILASCPDCYVGLEAGGLLVDRHINLQSIVKGVYLCLERVSLDSLIFVLGTGACQKEQSRGGKDRHHNLFHIE